MGDIPRVGEMSALLTALVWAVAVMLFRKSGEKVHPIALNLFKNGLALILILSTMWLFGQTLSRRASLGDYYLLLLSGAIGLGIGDTLLFKSLNQIGAGLNAIVACLYSPFIIGLSMVWLGERLTALQIVGAAIVVLAVLSTTRKGALGNITRKDFLWGTLWGVLATACVAVAAVMIKPVLNRSPLLWATQIRILGAIPTLGIIIAMHPLRRRVISSLGSPGSWGYTVGGSFAGQYGAMLLWLAGMKYAQASVASALNQTSTIWVVLLAALFLRERLSVQRIGAALAAVLGALLVTFG